MDADGKTHGEWTSPPTVIERNADGTEAQSISLLYITGTSVPDLGDYEIEIRVGGVVLGVVPFRVMGPPQSSAKA